MTEEGFTRRFHSLIEYFGQKEPEFPFEDDEFDVDDKKEPGSKLIPKVLPRKFTMKEVSQHCEKSSCWIVIMDKVYDVTSFMHEHPGGEDLILEDGGRDVTITFTEKGHSKDALLMLPPYCIGSLVDADKVVKLKRSISI